jgi:hypothetical protein
MIKPFVALALLAAAGSANAAVRTLFADDFESDTPGSRITGALSNWTVQGSVDVIGMPNELGITCAGNCASLAAVGRTGLIRTGSIAFAAGQAVRTEFDLSGDQRPLFLGTDEYGILFRFSPAIDIESGSAFFPGFRLPNLGSGTNVPAFSRRVEVRRDTGFSRYFFEFTPVQAGSMVVQFQGFGSVGYGPLLDNVVVTQVPEPATWAMLIAGFGLVGTAMRRRRTAVAA